MLPYLTLTKITANLNMHPQKTGVGIAVSETNGASRFNAAFLCAKSQFTVMFGWVRQSKDWLVPFVPVLQPCSVRHHDCSLVVGSKTLQTEAIMPIHNRTTKPPKTNTLTSSVSPKSIFFLIDSNRNTIARDLSFDQAKPISKYITGSLIKFQKMVVEGGVL